MRINASHQNGGALFFVSKLDANICIRSLLCQKRTLIHAAVKSKMFGTEHFVEVDPMRRVLDIAGCNNLESRVKERRIEKNLTQEQLAQMSAVPRSTIANIEDGGRVPGVDIAINLARALETTVEALFIV